MVPAHQVVLHQYIRESSWPGRKDDSEGGQPYQIRRAETMAVGEGAGELVKQLLCRTYDHSRPLWYWYT